MGPKNISVLSDSPAKDMSVMDRMCLKLEALCLEADKNPSLLFQEATKYVESQVTTVGSNMRKLCAEIMRDLLPPSNTPEATDEDTLSGDKSAKALDKELQPHKQVQPEVTHKSAKALDKEVQVQPEVTHKSGKAIDQEIQHKQVQPEVTHKSAKALDKEVQQHKQVQQEVTLQQQSVHCVANDKIILTLTLDEESKKGPNTTVKKAKISETDIRQSVRVAETGNSIEEAVEKETAKLNLPMNCLDENRFGRPEKLDEYVPCLFEEPSSSFNLKGQPFVPKIREDFEQRAIWYVGSEYREALMQRISETASSLGHIEERKSGRQLDQSDLDWELL